MTIKWQYINSPVEYSSFIDRMEKRVMDVISYNKPETVYMLEHQDVYTAGTNHDENELLGVNEIPVITTGRGGKYTYHGPGQAIIYPIIDLKKDNRVKDIRQYVRDLENIAINTLKHYDIDSYTIKDKVGIWTDKNNTPAKIGAIGIRIKKWVTYHGIAINISTDLDKYQGIIPCGIKEFPVTSLRELGVKTSRPQFNHYFKEEFEKIFK